MREPSKDPKRLADILEAIDNIFQYVGDDDIVWKVIDEDLRILRPQIIGYLEISPKQES